MHWQIRAWDGTVKYLNPNKYQIEMYNCKLINKINAARKVNVAGKKDVCGWVECDNFDILEKDSINTNYYDQLSYNPITDVHWRRSGDDREFNWDNSEYEYLITDSHRVFIAQESCSLV